jgi:hypothetical protein
MALSWIALLAVCLLPTLVLFRPGRGWLLGSSVSPFVWIVLGAVAFVGVLGRGNFLPKPIAVTPLLQAVAFISLDWFFRVRFNRAPLPYDQARYGHTPEGRTYWPDRMFWLAVLLVLTLGGLCLCIVFGVKFPSRHDAS